MAIEKDIRAAPVVIVGLVGVVLTFVVIVLVSALFLQVKEGEIEAQAGAQGPGEMERLRQEQTAGLAEYRLVDREKGVVAIPISRAVDLMVEEAGAEEDR